MTIGSLFSGIGGLELGLERAGLGPVLWQVERDPFCREVLHKHWPEATQYNDVSTVGKADIVPVDVLCGGFPCQPFSLAGKRKGEADERHLWPQFARIIGEIRPRFVVAENVLGLRTAGLPGVLADLAALGYDAEWHCASAVELGAPHIRRRIFVLAADANRVNLRDELWGLAGAFAAAFAPVPGHIVEGGDASHADSLRRLEQARRVANERGWSRLIGWELADVAGMDDGFPVRLGAARKAYGNAVVPQCAEVVGKVIMQMQQEAA